MTFFHTLFFNGFLHKFALRAKCDAFFKAWILMFSQRPKLFLLLGKRTLLHYGIEIMIFRQNTNADAAEDTIRNDLFSLKTL